MRIAQKPTKAAIVERVTTTVGLLLSFVFVLAILIIIVSLSLLSSSRLSDFSERLYVLVTD
jgi:hypothetical protein